MKSFIFVFCVFSTTNIFVLCEDVATVQKRNNLTTEEVILSNGYPCEEHHLTAPDGAVTVTYRIPCTLHDCKNSSRIPVIIHHGIMQSSFSFVINVNNNSLAFLLVNQGYDVWLANMRGTRFSRYNTKYSDTNPDFWNFSFQETAEYDLPLLIDYILEKTGHKKVFYLGYSLGTLIGFSFLASKPEYNDKIHALVQLAPVIYEHKNPEFHKGFVSVVFKALFQHQEYLQFHHILAVPVDRILENIYVLCRSLGILHRCVALLFYVTGDSVQHINAFKDTDYFLSSFDTISLKTGFHGYQKRFQKFDYGAEKNWKVYNQSTPPLYDMSNIKVPVGLFWSIYDKIADPWDCQLLRQVLTNLQYSVPISSPGFGHFSFLWSRHVKEYVYNPMIQFMSRFLKDL